jgi:hypothetical protein
VSSYDPEFVQIMRAGLDEVRSKVPAGLATPAIKAQVAEFILKSADGQTSYRRPSVASNSDNSFGYEVSIEMQISFYQCLKF